MRRLILMRHAKTEPWTEGVDDFGRALLGQGVSDARNIGMDIVARGWSPQQILVSTARRARETCSEIAKIVEGEKVRPMESLYLSGVRGIEDVVIQNEGTETLMVIGHNPGLHDFALSILRHAGSREHNLALRLSAKFPTGCCAMFEAETDSSFVPTAFKLIEVIRAKDLRIDI